MTNLGHWLFVSYLLLFGVSISGITHAEPLNIKTAQWQHEPTLGYGLTPIVIEHAADALWERVSLPHALPRTLLDAHSADTKPVADSSSRTTTTFYKLTLPQDHRWGDGARYLYIPRIKMNGLISVYANQHLIYQSDTHIYWNGANTPKWIALDKNFNSRDLSEITIQVTHPRQSGGGISSVWIGTHQEINWRYRIRSLLQNELPYAFSSAFLAIGIFGFFIWIARKDDKFYLLFFGVACTSFIRTLHYHIGVTRLPISEDLLAWLTLNSLFWMVWIVHRFLNYLHDRPSRRLNFSISVIVIAVGILTSPVFSVWIDSYHLSPFFYIILIGIGFVASLHGWNQSALAHSQDGRLLAFWGLLGMAMGSYDLLLQNNVINIESIYLGPFTNIFAFLILMRIIYGRYMAAIDEVRAVNASLQERLDAREKELEKSHELLRQVEVQRQLSQERQRLMQDMHDGMGSNLRTALLAVEAGKLNPPAVADILKDCIDDLKLTIDSMEPMDADLLLLLAMFRFRFGTRLEAAGITLHWDVQPIPKVKNLTPQSTLHIFRIFQEAFANVIKHSGATQITVSTRVSSNHVSVIISDNGRGFSLNTGHVGDGRGLLNQKRRAEFIGATIDWITGPTGTQMTLLLPID